MTRTAHVFDRFNGAAIAHQIEYDLHIKDLIVQLADAAGPAYPEALAFANANQGSGSTRIQALSHAIRIYSQPQVTPDEMGRIA